MKSPAKAGSVAIVAQTYMAVAFVMLCSVLAPAEQKSVTQKTVAHVRTIVKGTDSDGINVPFGPNDYLCPAGFDGALEEWGPQILTYAPRWDKLHGGTGHTFWKPACISRRDMVLTDKDLATLLQRLGFGDF